MNPIIKRELEKCNFMLPEYNDNTIFISIVKDNNKLKNKEIEPERDHYYIIKLQYYILNPPDTFTLSSNWNKGINPKSEYLLGTPIKFIGKMIQWDACGYDMKNKISLSDIYNELWLPQKGFEIIEEVDSKYGR